LIAADTMVGKEQEQTRQSSQSSNDEDCSGVVDGPNLKVKDIRAMFRGGPDYQDFAKPRVHIKPRPIRISSLSSLSPTEASSMNSPLNEQVKSPVSEQVMGLFREALEIQDQDSHATNGTTKTNGTTNGSAEKRIPPIPPVRKHKVLAKQTSAQANLQYLRNQESQDAPPVKEDLRKSIARIKSESGQVESFEKSLDEFYDVFDNLTS